MGWPGKNQDPFDARAKALADQIRQLERQIRELSQQPPPTKPTPTPSPTTTQPTPTPIPPATSRRPSPGLPTKPQSSAPNPVPVPHTPPKSPPDARINPHGIRKFDLSSVWHRFLQTFKGPSPTNPRMVHYLAAGSVHGLRPLRYEKRVARNRFIGLFLLLVLILFGLARVYFP
jgi:hypothetical protein